MPAVPRPLREFLGPILFHLNSHFSPLQPHALGNLYLLSQLHFLQIPTTCLKPLLQVSECDLMSCLGFEVASNPKPGPPINFLRMSGDSPPFIPLPPIIRQC